MMHSSPESSSAASNSPADEIGMDALESAVKQVVSSSDLEKVSLRELRRKVEQKLGLPKLALDKNKNTIKEMVGKAITETEQKAEDKVKAEVIASGPLSKSATVTTPQASVKREREGSASSGVVRKRAKKEEKTEDSEGSSPSASSGSGSSASSDATSDEDSDSNFSAPAKKAAPKRRARSTTPPPAGLTKKSFEKKAKPLKLTLGKQEINIPARVFKTGSCGWWGRSNIKVPVGKNKVMASCQFQIIVQKSKEWPEK